jgi:hypothetical protein
MQRLRIASLLCLFALSSTAFTGVAPAQTPSVAQKLTSAMIEALGGQAFLDVKEIQTNGRFFSFRRGEVSGAQIYADFVKFPDMERTEFGKEKEKTIKINKGDEGWLVSGKDEKDVKVQSAREAEEFLSDIKTSFDFVTRFVLNTPKTTLLATGTETIDFRRTDIVEMRDTAKNLFRFYVDRETRLPAKFQVRKANDSVLFEETYGNWHKFQGIMSPLFITRYKDGVKTMEIRADKVAYNPGFPDSLFTVSAAAK